MDDYVFEHLYDFHFYYLTEVDNNLSRLDELDTVYRDFTHDIP